MKWMQLAVLAVVGAWPGAPARSVEAASPGAPVRAVAPPPVRLEVTGEGAARVLRLVPGDGVKLNARLAPALEASGGRIVRFTMGARDAAGDYFTEPATARWRWTDRPAGLLRAGVCYKGEKVCRVVTMPV